MPEQTQLAVLKETFTISHNDEPFILKKILGTTQASNKANNDSVWLAEKQGSTDDSGLRVFKFQRRFNHVDDKEILQNEKRISDFINQTGDEQCKEYFLNAPSDGEQDKGFYYLCYQFDSRYFITKTDPEHNNKYSQFTSRTLTSFITKLHRQRFEIKDNLKLARKISEKLFSALRCLRQINIVHGDISPNNILISEDASSLVLIDLEFGQNIKEDAVSNKGGTPGFRSPERAENNNFATDLYSVVCCLYYLLTNEKPPTEFRENEVGIVGHKLYPSLQEFFSKATSYQPNDRYESIDQISTAFEAALNNQSSPQQPKAKKRKPKWFIGIFLIVLLLFILIINSDVFEQELVDVSESNPPESKPTIEVSFKKSLMRTVEGQLELSGQDLPTVNRVEVKLDNQFCKVNTINSTAGTYKYHCKSHHSGLVDYQVLSNNNVLSQGKVNVEPYSTQIRFTNNLKNNWQAKQQIYLYNGNDKTPYEQSIAYPEGKYEVIAKSPDERFYGVAAPMNIEISPEHQEFKINYPERDNSKPEVKLFINQENDTGLSATVFAKDDVGINKLTAIVKNKQGQIVSSEKLILDEIYDNQKANQWFSKPWSTEKRIADNEYSILIEAEDDFGRRSEFTLYSLDNCNGINKSCAKRSENRQIFIIGLTTKEEEIKTYRENIKSIFTEEKFDKLKAVNHASFYFVNNKIQLKYESEVDRLLNSGYVQYINQRLGKVKIATTTTLEELLKAGLATDRKTDDHEINIVVSKATILQTSRQLPHEVISKINKMVKTVSEQTTTKSNIRLFIVGKNTRTECGKDIKQLFPSVLLDKCKYIIPNTLRQNIHKLMKI